MLKRDDDLRLSDEVQALYALQPESWEWKWQVTDEVQRKVCEEFGFGENIEEGLDLMRSCMTLFPDDEKVKQTAHYLRQNIHIDCPLRVGEIVPDLPLYTLSGEARQLQSTIKSGRATVLIAGSHT